MKRLPLGAFGPIAMVLMVLAQAVLAGPMISVDISAPMPVLAVAGLCCLYPAHTSRLGPMFLFLVGIVCDLLAGTMLGTVPLTLLALRFAISALRFRFATAPRWFYSWIWGPLLTILATLAVLVVGLGPAVGLPDRHAAIFQIAVILLLYPMILQSFVLLQYLFEPPPRRHEAI